MRLRYRIQVAYARATKSCPGGNERFRPGACPTDGKAPMLEQKHPGHQNTLPRSIPSSPSVGNGSDAVKHALGKALMTRTTIAILVWQ